MFAFVVFDVTLGEGGVSRKWTAGWIFIVCPL